MLLLLLLLLWLLLTVDRLAAGAFLLPKAANGVVVPRVQVGVVVVIVGLVPANIRK